MQRTPVDSSSIKAIGHEKNVLSVEFKTGAVYHYQNVPPSIAQKLMEAESVGGYFAANIRDRFKGAKVG